MQCAEKEEKLKKEAPPPPKTMKEAKNKKRTEKKGNENLKWANVKREKRIEIEALQEECSRDNSQDIILPLTWKVEID